MQFHAFNFGCVFASRIFFQKFQRVYKKYSFFSVVVKFCISRNFNETAGFNLFSENFCVVFFVAFEKFFTGNAVAIVSHAERNTNRAGFEFAQIHAVFIATADFADNDNFAALFGNIRNFRDVARNFLANNFFSGQIIFRRILSGGRCRFFSRRFFRRRFFFRRRLCSNSRIIFNFNVSFVTVVQKFFGDAQNIFVKIFIRDKIYFPVIYFRRNYNFVDETTLQRCAFFFAGIEIRQYFAENFYIIDFKSVLIHTNRHSKNF